MAIVHHFQAPEYVESSTVRINGLYFILAAAAVPDKSGRQFGDGRGWRSGQRVLRSLTYH